MCMEKYQKKLQEKYPDELLKILNFQGYKKPVDIQCLRCGKKWHFSQLSSCFQKTKKNLCQECGKALALRKRFEQSLKDRFPNEPYILQVFSNTQSEGSILCPKCHSIYSFQHMASVYNRVHICNTCHPFRNEELQITKDKFIEYTNNSLDWKLSQSLQDIHSQEKIKCVCLHCGKINEKTMYDYMRGIHCQCQRQNKSLKEEEQKIAGNEYKIISGGDTLDSRLFLQHVCGFKYSVSTKTFVNGWGRCPKCEKNHSKGERAIKHWLDENNISYEIEFPKILEGHVLRFDFYLPDYDIYIEFQGKQHYEQVDFFDKKASLEKRQSFDNLKREFCKQKLIEIPYYDIDKIPEILSSKVQRLS